MITEIAEFDPTVVPSEPERMQYMRAVMPKGFLCIACHAWTMPGTLATVYWSKRAGWGAAACAHHVPREGFDPVEDRYLKNNGTDELLNRDEAQKSEAVWARDAVLISRDAPIVLDKHYAFRSVVRSIWMRLLEHGSISLMNRIFTFRNVTHDKRDEFVAGHPAVIVLVAKLASLCGLELTSKSKKKVDLAEHHCKVLADMLP